jgi:hypothetical protein
MVGSKTVHGGVHAGVLKQACLSWGYEGGFAEDRQGLSPKEDVAELPMAGAVCAAAVLVHMHGARRLASGQPVSLTRELTGLRKSLVRAP